MLWNSQSDCVKPCPTSSCGNSQSQPVLKTTMVVFFLGHSTPICRRFWYGFVRLVFDRNLNTTASYWLNRVDLCFRWCWLVAHRNFSTWVCSSQLWRLFILLTLDLLKMSLVPMENPLRNLVEMGVSSNRGTPKSSILMGFLYKPSIWGYPHVWNPPNISYSLMVPQIQVCAPA